MKSGLTHIVDRFEKIAKETQLTPSEKRQQAIQFAGLGMAALPAIESVKSRIQQGSWIPKGMTRGRFLAGSALGGLFWGGLLPAAHHRIARYNLRNAEIRADAEKELKNLTGISGIKVPNV